MLDVSASACPDGQPVSYAQRIARGAQSPAMQALIAAAPRPTREQLDIARTACASATSRYRERETATGVGVDHGALGRRREAPRRPMISSC